MDSTRLRVSCMLLRNALSILPSPSSAMQWGFIIKCQYCLKAGSLVAVGICHRHNGDYYCYLRVMYSPG